MLLKIIDLWYANYTLQLFQIADDYCPTGVNQIDLAGFGVLSKCVAINQCSELLDNRNAPLNQTLPCGFDQEQNLVKICCPSAYVTETQVRETFTIKTGFKADSHNPA